MRSLRYASANVTIIASIHSNKNGIHLQVCLQDGVQLINDGADIILMLPYRAECRRNLVLAAFRQAGCETVTAAPERATACFNPSIGSSNR